MSRRPGLGYLHSRSGTAYSRRVSRPVFVRLYGNVRPQCYRLSLFRGHLVCKSVKAYGKRPTATAGRVTRARDVGRVVAGHVRGFSQPIRMLNGPDLAPARSTRKRKRLDNDNNERGTDGQDKTRQDKTRHETAVSYRPRLTFNSVACERRVRPTDHVAVRRTRLHAPLFLDTFRACTRRGRAGRVFTCQSESIRPRTVFSRANPSERTGPARITRDTVSPLLDRFGHVLSTNDNLTTERVIRSRLSVKRISGNTTCMRDMRSVR